MNDRTIDRLGYIKIIGLITQNESVNVLSADFGTGTIAIKSLGNDEDGFIVTLSFNIIPKTDFRIFICAHNYTTIQECVAFFTASFGE